MISGIVSGAPIWVWPLLVLLLVLGARAMRPRLAPTMMIYMLPLLGGLSVNAVNNLPAVGYVWGVFVAGYLGGALAGYWVQRDWILGKSGSRVSLAGEGLTMTVLMAIFWMNFFGGVFRSVSPDTYESGSFHMTFALIAGLAAGSFMGRAFRVYQAPVT